MITKAYANLKVHFDKFFKGGQPNTGLESIRDIYEDGFGTPIHMYDIYQTPLQSARNYIDKLIILFGPERKDKELKCGVIPYSDKEIAFVTVITNDFTKGPDNVNPYIMEVFSTMWSVISYDVMAGSLDNMSHSADNPYKEFLAMSAFYLTFHHIKDNFPDAVKSETLINILEKYYCSSTEDAMKILDFLNKEKYNYCFDKVYYAMTCGNTVDLFC